HRFDHAGVGAHRLLITRMAGFLHNLLLSGARPLARPKVPARSSAPVRERSEERAASVPEAPLAAPVDPPAAAPPPPPPAEPVMVAAPDAEPEPPEPPT